MLELPSTLAILSTIRCVSINDRSELGEDDLWYCEACAATYGPIHHEQVPRPYTGLNFYREREPSQTIPSSTALFQQLAPPSPVPPWVPRNDVPKLERLQRLNPNSLDIPWSSPPHTSGRTGNLLSAHYDRIELLKTPLRNKQPYYSPAL
ncbi:hypothetical protein DL96DRAFT_1621272 [Flagelloscypha sp. PMI_526]|nr:hypothetical protein DL96DRAFT_1621272 [Flagelloscypha sp. PMI_526]